MTKKTWEKPEVKALMVEKTEYGTNITNNVDATYQFGPFTFYSFS